MARGLRCLGRLPGSLEAAVGNPLGKKREVSMIRIIVPTFAVAFATLMAYGFYLQAKIWHLL